MIGLFTTDGAAPEAVARALLDSALAWEPEARPIGGIRAADLVLMCQFFLSEDGAENPGCNRCGTNDRLEGCRWCLQCEAMRSADELQDEYAEANEHPAVPRSDWEYQVGDGDTSLGYWAFVLQQLELRAFDEETK
jgi:hypothetical protein